MSKKMDIPAAYFSQEEVETFHSFAGKVLTSVNYFIWVQPENKQQRFLYCIELLFNLDESLLVMVDEDEYNLKIVGVNEFIAKASSLKDQNSGIAVLQQADPSVIEPWKSVVGSLLLGVRLTAGDEGLYTNDALLLDFVDKGVIVAINDNGGILVVAR